MAEVVGVVASAVGIAAFGQQLASSILKIKGFCEDVKDAPKELRDVLDQIENISNIMSRLGRVEDTATVTEVDDIFQASAQLCRTAIGRISTLAQELEEEMTRSRVRGSVRTVLKMKTLEKLIAKLERNKADLLIAHSMYTDIRKSKELERLHRCVEEMREGQMQIIQYVQTISSQPMDFPAQPEAHQPIDRILLKRRSAPSSKFYVRLPLWLCQYAWDVTFERASGCWNIALRSFRIVPCSTIFYLGYHGDIKRVRLLLEARQLSVHDQDEYGHTVTSVGIEVVVRGIENPQLMLHRLLSYIARLS